MTVSSVREKKSVPLFLSRTPLIESKKLNGTDVAWPERYTGDIE